MMPILKIPNSSVEISRLGFGCARLFGGSEMRTSARIIEAALKHGITHFDTAPMYGSENVLGELLEGINNVTIATKVGIAGSTDNFSIKKNIVGPLYRHTLRPIMGRFPILKSKILGITSRQTKNIGAPPIMKRYLHRDEVLRELESSLKRLRRTKIDLYFLHEPEQFEITDELRELFESLQSSGVIGAFGLGYDGVQPKPKIEFGSVAQCRYENRIEAFENAKPARIFHGVLRFGLADETRRNKDWSAGQQLNHVLQTYNKDGILFSASSVYQIDEIAKNVILSQIQ